MSRIKIFLLILLTFCFLPHYLRADSAEMDSSFGTNGSLPLSLTADEHLVDLLVDPEGIITAVATSYSSTTDVASAILFRFDANGHPVTTFGENGKKITPLGTMGVNYILSTALQSDGKILAGGLLTLERFNTDGNLDPTFGPDHTGVIDLHELAHTDLVRVYGLAIQSDSKIIIVGDRQGFVTHPDGTYGSQFGFSVMRFNTEGTLDTGFDGDGKAFAFEEEGYIPTGVVIGPLGKILVYSESHTVMAQFLPDGSLDEGFGASGKLIRPVVVIEDVALRPDGKMVVCGSGMCWQLNTDGSRDATFGNAGKIDTGHHGSGTHVALQDDGKIVIAGATQGVLRYSASGQPDSSFTSAITAPGPYSSVDVLKILPGNKILMLGLNADGTPQMGQVLGGALAPDADTIASAGGTGITGSADATVAVVSGGELIATGSEASVSGTGISGAPTDIQAPANSMPSGTGDAGTPGDSGDDAESAGSATNGSHAAGGCSLVR